MATCDECGKEIAGSGFAGAVGGTFCSSGCRSTAEIEVAARLLAARMDREAKKRP